MGIKTSHEDLAGVIRDYAIENAQLRLDNAKYLRTITEMEMAQAAEAEEKPVKKAK